MLNCRISKIVVFILICCSVSYSRSTGPFLGDGFRNGWADQDSIVIWTRLTSRPEGNAEGKAFLLPDKKIISQMNKSSDTVKQIAVQIPKGASLDDMEGACPGANGQVQLTYYPRLKPDKKKQTGWKQVDPDKDFTAQWKLSDLMPDTWYEVLIEARKDTSSVITDSMDGKFRTAPLPQQHEDILFMVVTCHDYPRRDAGINGHYIYDSMSGMNPDFYVHTGDVEYYDKPYPYAWNEELIRFTWNRLFALKFQRQFYANHTTYFMKDDHDTLKNDTWGGQRYGAVTFERGVEIFDTEQFPCNDKPYKTIRWGKSLQIWLVEGRNYRSSNRMPDGPEKTIWGIQQKEWFFRTVSESNATFKVLISPTPILGPDRENKSDNHANKVFKHEGDELRAFIDKQKMFITNGDRHWQYVTHIDGTNLWEFGTGAGSDSHAEGWNQNDRRPQHRFLRVKGGFLSVHVTQKDDVKRITFTHHDVMGTEVHRETFTGDER